jgi:hypothetical protein
LLPWAERYVVTGIGAVGVPDRDFQPVNTVTVKLNAVKAELDCEIAVDNIDILSARNC